MPPMILRRRFTSAIAVIFTFFLTACASQIPSTPATVPATPTAALSDRAIVPGERIGPVRLAGKIDEVVKLFGPGTIMRPRGREVYVLQTWDSIDLWVQFDPGTGNIVWISVDTSASNQWAEHSTPEGIRLGTRQQDLVSVMGPPERTVTGGGGTSFYYDRRGIRFTLDDAGPLAGKVASLRVVWASSVPRGDTLVVPGKRISIIEVGAPVDRVVAILGGGYQRREGSPGIHVYYWPHLGLGFAEQAGHVISVTAVGADAPGPRYSTVDGLGRDSSASQIKDMFGERPEAVASQFSGTDLIYRSRGIAFEIDEELKARTVTVFPPK